jgi:hypothetical protein
MAWTLRGLMVMPCWETMKPNRRPTVTQNDTLQGVEMNIVSSTMFKDDPKIFYVLGVLFRMSGEVI